MFKFGASEFLFSGLLVSLFILMGIATSVQGEVENVDARVEELLKKMTLPEKIGQMTQINSRRGQIPEALKQRLRDGRLGSMLNETNPEISLEIQRIAREESRLGIPIIMGRDVIHGFRTILPIPLGQAATWNLELVRAGAALAAGEAAAAGFHWTFTPMMDIARDPRWGRIAEGFGEDPWLGSVMAAAMVKGFQGDDLSAPNTIAACAKHFAGYGAAEGGKDYNTANIPENLLRDVYLPPFKAAVDAGVATFMSAFNEVNGVPATGSTLLLRKILREEWGFQGFVVSDWESMEEMIDHGFCTDLRDVAVKSITAGVDMEMQSTAYLDHLEKLVADGTIPVKLVDDAVRGILKIKFELGLFEKKPPYSAKLAPQPTEKALALAKKAALKSVVLLKNDEKFLPLSKDIESVAVIGPLADDPYEVLGTWNRDGKTEDTVTPLAAIKKYLGQNTAINYAKGLEYSRSRDESGFAEAVAQAKNSGVVLYFAGEEAILSGEAHSRAFLELPGAQNKLLDALTETGKPIVLIVLAGRPLTIGEAAEKSKSVLYAWHPGTMTGPALTDLIFGVESPSGKLPVSFPRTEGQIPVYYNHKNTGRPPSRTNLVMIDDIPARAYQSSIGDASRYLDIDFKPLYPFGFGLSYAKFKYANIALSKSEVKNGDNFQVSVDITNTGDVEADEIAQLYVRDLVGSVTRPVKELKGFQTVRLKPNETKQLVFEIATSNLGFHNPEMKYVVEPGDFLLWVGGDSQSGLQAQFQIIE